jgi:pantoate--beta-alanine ligase
VHVFSTKQELLDWRKCQTAETVSFVPTMGALHEGHTSLIKAARKNSDLSVVSIFVNPLQFGLNEDLAKYPKTTQNDLSVCQQLEADAVFIPATDELYQSALDELTIVQPRPRLANCLCGALRPGHFAGVLTVVLKLFNLVQPTKVFFGQKDYQQYLLIKYMIQDLNLNIDIIPMPIIRAASGLALSSRNQYLSSSELQEAAQLYQTLKQASNLIKEGNPISDVLKSLKQPNFQYFEARHPETLETTTSLPARLFLAAKIGSARLIDNIEV